jgi:hypothetical protein
VELLRKERGDLGKEGLLEDVRLELEAVECKE